MQPTYLPWIGFFNLIYRSKDFVFFDDVRLKKRSWQTRNRVLQNGKEVMLTVPLEKASREDLIYQVKVQDNILWREKHLSTIKHAYKSTKYGDEVIDILTPILKNYEHKKIADLNIEIIMKFSEVLALDTQFYRSKDLESRGVRSEKLLSLCEAIGNLNYLSPMGSKTYIEEDKILMEELKTLEFQDYIPKEYPQIDTNEFVPYMSIVDVMSNCGIKKTRELIFN